MPLAQLLCLPWVSVCPWSVWFRDVAGTELGMEWHTSSPPLLQTQYDALKKQMEVMEMEVMEARLIRAAEINGEVDDDDAGGSEAGAASSVVA